MFVAIIHQGRHQHFGTVADAFNLKFHELIRALTERLCGAHPLSFHQALDALTQIAIGDADKAPRLHQADTGPLMRRFQQTRQLFGRHLTLDEVTHVATLGDGPVYRRAFGVRKSLVAHGANSAAAAWGLEAK
ncbi:hypothetical protein D3C78_920030 [compost metagenome]